jgi:hypothetical protein
MGRFTSADPYNIVLETQATAEIIQDKARAQFLSYLSRPQNWNRYVYVANNPLKYVDPTGEFLELTGSEEDRKKAFLRLQQMVGAEAGKTLYVVEAQDSKGNTHYYVESTAKDLGAAGAGQLGSFISQIIDSNNGVEFRIANQFDTRNGHFTTAAFGGAATVGREESLTGNTQIFVQEDAGDYVTWNYGITGMGRNASSNGRQLDFYDDIVDAHEFGHAYGNAIEGQPLHNSNATNQRALDFENYVRERRGLSNRRIRHSGLF